MALVPVGDGPGQSGELGMARAAGRASSAQHMGNVFLDWNNFTQRWCISHIVTNEQVALDISTEAGPELVFDEEGFGCLVCTGEAGQSIAPLLLDGLMRETMFITASGEVVIAENDGTGGGLQGSLQALCAVWHLARLDCSLGPLNQRASLDLGIFERARVGCHAWWSLLSIYQSGGFVFKVKYSSVWLHKHLQSWLEMLAWLGCHGHISQSRPYGSHDADAEGMRTLPFVAASSIALVALLSAWLFGPRRRCGMQDASNQGRAEFVLAALLQALPPRGHPGWRLRLLCCEHVDFRWPRPDDGSTPAEVVVIDGMVPIAELLEIATSSRHAGARSMERLFRNVPNENGVISLLDFVGHAWKASTSSAGLSLLKQLVRNIGLQLDAQIIGSAGEEVILPASFDLQNLGCDFGSSYKLDRFLHTYVQGTRSMFSGGLFHSVCADKSRVGGQGLQDGAIVRLDNVGAWMVPQVALDGSFGASPRPWSRGRRGRCLLSV